VVQRRIQYINGGFVADDAGQGNGYALLYQGGRLSNFLEGDQIDRPTFVILTPASQLLRDVKSSSTVFSVSPKLSSIFLLLRLSEPLRATVPPSPVSHAVEVQVSWESDSMIGSTEAIRAL